MKSNKVELLLASLIAIISVSDSWAARLELPIVLVPEPTDKNQVQSAAATSSVGEIVIGGAEIVFAELQFEGDLIPNTEVELWPIGSDGESPDHFFGRNIWTMEERTGNLARFDITSLARAWSSGAYPNHGLLFFVIEPEDLPETMSSAIAPILPTIGSLILYTRSVEVAKPKEPSKRGRTEPRPEDGGQED